MKKVYTLAITLLPTAMFAHGGHGYFDPSTLMHYAGTPEHALPIALALVAVYILRRHRLKTATK